MFGIGWTEMLVIGVVALIVIGPKDLPVVMARVGKIVGQIRRMGNEFQREINKTTGLNEIRNLRSSITEPLRKTTEEIRKEFNAMTPSGVKPSGIIKPADPKAESVVNEIHAAAGIAAPAAVVAPVAAAPVVANKAPRNAPAKAKAVPKSIVATTDLAPVAEPVKAARPAAKKPAAKPIETPVAVAAPVAKAPIRKAAATKTAAAKPVAATPARPKKPAAKKPAVKAGEA